MSAPRSADGAPSTAWASSARERVEKSSRQPSAWRITQGGRPSTVMPLDRRLMLPERRSTGKRVESTRARSAADKAAGTGTSFVRSSRSTKSAGTA